MLKQLAALEVKIEDRIYHLVCDHNSPLGEVHDALCRMKDHVVNRIKEAHEQEKAQGKPQEGKTE